METIPPKRRYVRHLLQNSGSRRWLALATLLLLSCCAFLLAN